jgi:Trypsin-like peptidase domain/PBS lyase HEAT-like repeat
VSDPGPGCQDLLRAATVALEVSSQAREHPARATGFFVAPGMVATCAHVLSDTRATLPERVFGSLTSGQPVSLETVPEWYLRAEPGGLDVAFLRVLDAVDVPHVLLSGALALRDPLWAYGHPGGQFRAGQSAGFTYQGPSKLRVVGNQWEPHRLIGTPVGGGYSGSPALNLRTGAVCGMLCTSDEAGSAHMVSADDILAGNSIVREAQSALKGNARWLGCLSDDQIIAGGWLFPGPRLRSYLDAAARAAADHPYPGVVPGVAPPPLSAVYVRQQAEPVAVTADESPVDLETRPAEEIVHGEQDCVLIGGPGAGKSSLLRTALITAARKWQDGEVGTEVPVHLLASDLIPASPLPDLIAAGVTASLSGVGILKAWSADFFGKNPLHGVRWLILVDGLDEILDPAARRRVLDKIIGIRHAESDVQYRFIVATRPLATAEFPAHDKWPAPRYELQPFVPEQLIEFAERWFAELRLNQPSQTARAFVAALYLARLTDPARTPLMATMLCQLYAANPDRKLPAGRSGAYREFVDLLRRRQYEDSASGIYAQMQALLGPYGPAATAPAGALLTTAMDLISRLALERQEGGDGLAVDLLTEWTEGDRPRHVPEEKWRSFLREILRRSGLLTQRGDDFQFIHQTVNEFLAAQRVTADPRRRLAVHEELFGRWQQGAWIPPSWDESYSRFIVASWPDKPGLADALLRLAKEGGVPGGRFIASLVADSALPDPAVANEAAASLATIASDANALFLLRRSACEVLAQLGDPRGADLLADLAADSAIAAALKLQAAEALIRIGDPRGADALARLADALEPHLTVRRWAAEGLARIGDPRCMALLVAIVRDSTFVDDNRADAMRILIQLARRDHANQLYASTDKLAVLAADAEIAAAERVQAARALLQIGDHRASDLLAGIVNEPDKDRDIRLSAAKSLAEIQDSRAAAFLASLVTDATNVPHTSRRLAADALVELGSADLLAALALKATDSPARYGAAEALAWIGDDRYAGALALLAADPAAETGSRLKATEALVLAGDRRGAELAAGFAANPMLSMSVRCKAAWIVVRAPHALGALLRQILIGASSSQRRLATAELARLIGHQAVGLLEALTSIRRSENGLDHYEALVRNMVKLFSDRESDYFHRARFYFPDELPGMVSYLRAVQASGFWRYRLSDDRDQNRLALFLARISLDDLPRIHAAESLAWLGESRGRDILAALSADSGLEISVRVEASLVLGHLGDHRAADLLVGITDDEWLLPGQRIEATVALALVDAPRSIFRLAALVTELSLGDDSQESVATILTRLATTENANLLAELASNKEIGEQARINAADALCRFGDDRGTRLLALLADDETASAVGRIEAAEALAISDVPRAVSFLAVLSLDRSLASGFRGSAAEALASLGQASTADRLAALAADRALPIFSRIEVAGALGRLGDARAADLLRALADDPAYDLYARKWASDALSGLSRDGEQKCQADNGEPEG